MSLADDLTDAIHDYAKKHDLTVSFALDRHSGSVMICYAIDRQKRQCLVHAEYRNPPDIFEVTHYVEAQS